MKWHRIKALFLRHLFPLKRDFDLMSDIAYWPLVDTILWGVTGQWLSDASGVASFVATVLMGLIFWNVIWRAQSEVGRNLMDEIWNHNLVNIFSTPLHTSEWLASVVGLSLIKTLITLTVITPVIYLLYSVNALELGLWLPVFFALSVMTGWWIGLFSAGIVLRGGPKVQTVIWTLPGALLPFSAIYFPVDKLPQAMQTIAWMLPTTYVMESMRSVLLTGTLTVNYLWISLLLNVILLGLSGWFFMRSFAYSKKMGLDRFT
jgi:ABC-2 type transport system permease protein